MKIQSVMIFAVLLTIMVAVATKPFRIVRQVSWRTDPKEERAVLTKRWLLPNGEHRSFLVLLQRHQMVEVSDSTMNAVLDSLHLGTPVHVRYDLEMTAIVGRTDTSNVECREIRLLAVSPQALP